ncbi:MAG TPA: hypothetical protein VFI05_06725 [Nitrospiraceae bacterium]|nr:hypothetical protein [Nitrospiraceae bacterium]
MIDGAKRKGTPVLLACALVIIFSAFCGFAEDGTSITPNDPHHNDSKKNFWPSLIAQAKTAGLPTRFLLAMDPSFVTLEFDDLHAFAAEYHPENHQLILNRSLSFNAAGGTLKPVAQLTPRELGTLYHELFHAYLDYLSSLATPETVGPMAVRLLEFARDRQQCRYQQVSITPIVQRKGRTEVRFLTDRESWEALNETWAVFVGWSIWTKLEVQRGPSQSRRSAAAAQDSWIKRLKKADRDGDLIGYYEPESDAERAIARKRYLAPSHRITPQEVNRLLQDVLEYSKGEALRITGVLQQDRVALPQSPPCHDFDK